MSLYVVKRIEQSVKTGDAEKRIPCQAWKGYGFHEGVETSR